MRVNSQMPSFPVANGVTLGLRGLGYSLDDGVVVETGNDGRVYMTLGDQTQPLGDNESAVIRQIEAMSPGVVQQAAQSSFDWNSLLTNVSGLLTTVVTVEAQRDLLQANIERAKQGLPPLNAQAYMPGVNVGVTSDTKQMLMIGGGMLLAAIVLPSLLRPGRRR